MLIAAVYQVGYYSVLCVNCLSSKSPELEHQRVLPGNAMLLLYILLLYTIYTGSSSSSIL